MTIYRSVYVDANVQRRSSVRVLVPPAFADEPLKLLDVRQHLRIDPLVGGDSRDDGWIESMIPVVREWCENWLERSLAPQTLQLTANEFPASGAIELPYGPVIQVVSVSAGTSPFYDYYLNTADHIVGTWPSITPGFGAIVVTYRAGYATSSLNTTPPLPASILAAMKLMMGHFYENREASTALKIDTVPMGVVSLLEPYRFRKSFA